MNIGWEWYVSILKNTKDWNCHKVINVDKYLVIFQSGLFL